MAAAALRSSWVAAPRGALRSLPLALLLAAAPLRAQGFDDWYPRDIRPPDGTQYPCALTALPRDLPGIPPAERGFVNHAYTLILRATQAKLLLLKALAESDGAAGYLDYLRATEKAMRALRSEPVPPGLERFLADVVSALELQKSFFRKAVEARREGKSLDQVFSIPEGRAASSRLQAAFRRMSARYPDWTPEMRDSVYHHLCALDLF